MWKESTNWGSPLPKIDNSHFLRMIDVLKGHALIDVSKVFYPIINDWWDEESTYKYIFKVSKDVYYNTQKNLVRVFTHFLIFTTRANVWLSRTNVSKGIRKSRGKNDKRQTFFSYQPCNKEKAILFL